MKRKFTFLIAAALMLLTMMATTGTLWGQTRTEEVYSTCLFGLDYGTSSNYISTWTTTNGDFTWSVENGNTNYQSNSTTTGIPTSWDYVKFGRKNNASLGKITTATAYSEAVTKVVLTIDAINANNASNITSIKLYTSSTNTANSTWTEVGTFTKATGTQTVTLTTPTTNLFYKIEFDCASGSANGFITISKVEYYHSTGGSSPSITANNVNLAYDATQGSITYTVNNPVTGGEMSSSPVSGGDWLTVGGPNNGSVPLSCEANTATTARTATVRLTYSYGNSKETVTKDVTVTQTAAPIVCATIPELFAAATSVGNTATSAEVSLNNWVVSGVSSNGKNVFVTDGTNGFVIFDNGGDMGFTTGNILSGTVNCKVQLYNGFAEITQLNSQTTGISVTTGGTVTAADITMANLAGVNTGALVHYENLTCSVDNNKYYLTDGTTTLQVYNALYDFGTTLVANHYYNITGVYQQFNSTKEILPRSAADIEEYIPSTPTIILSASSFDLGDNNAVGEEISRTFTVSQSSLTAGITISVDGNGSVNPVSINQGAEDTEVTWTYTPTAVGEIAATISVSSTGAETQTITITGTAINGITGDCYEMVTEAQTDWSGGYLLTGINSTTYYALTGVNNNLGTTATVSTVGNKIESNTITDGYRVLVAATSNGYSLYMEGYGYLYYSGSSNNLYATSDFVDETCEWTFSFANNLVTLKNVSNTDRMLQFNYNSGNSRFACYTSNQVKLTLFKYTGTVVLPPVINVENPDVLAYNATSGTIDYEIENYVAGTMTAFTEATWISDFTYQQVDEMGEVGFTTTANDGAARQATVTLTYTYNTNQTVTKNVTVSQAALPVPTITVDPATVNAPAAGETNTLALTYQDITITEANDFDIQYYNANNEPLNTDPDWLLVVVEAGQTSGYVVSYTIDENDGEARTAYFKVFALGDQDYVYSNLVTVNQAANVPPVQTEDYAFFSGELVEGDYLIVYDGSAMKNTVDSDRLQYEEVTPSNNVISTNDATIIWHIAPSATSGYWTIYSANANAYAASTGVKNKAQMLADGTDDKALWSVESTAQSETYDFVNKQNTTNGVNATLRCNGTYGFACYANTTGGALSLYKKVDNTPSITLTPDTYNLNAEGGQAELPVVYNNMPADPQAEVIFYESDGVTPLTNNPTWITATINDNYNINGNIQANTGAARSAYFKVKGIDADNNAVYSNLVTINQTAYTLSIVFETTELDIEVGGEQNRVLSFEYQGLGDNPTFEVRCYESDGTTPATYEWLTTEIVEIHKVSITVPANTGAARTAYFKVYGSNSTVNTESNLVTINQDAYVAPTYTVTYVANGGTGTMTDPNSPYTENAEVTLLENAFGAPEGKIWDSWLVKDANQTTIDVNNNTFTMPASNVTVTAQWIDNPVVPTYEWVLTALEDLTSSDIFVIVGNNGSNYAMTNDNGTTSAPSASAVTIANDKLSNAPADNLKWNVEIGNNGYTFYPNGITNKWLYCTDANNGLRVGTGDNKVFAYEEVTTTDKEGYYLTITPESDKRYVCIYNNADWRSYKSGSIVKTDTKFYKRQVASTDPHLYTNDVDIECDATEGEINYTLENAVQGGELTAEITAGNEGGWLTLGAVGETVPFSCEPNTEQTERTATVTLTYTYNAKATVTATAVVTQAAFIIDYATLPFAYDGNGTGELPIGLTPTGLGTYGQSPAMKFDGTGDNLILKLNQAPVSLSYDIKGNSFSGGTFTVQTSANGTNYDDLATYTTLGDAVQSITHVDLDASVRYIKWIYTYKKTGNVALGNIHATEHYDTYGDVTLNDLDLTATSESLIVHSGSVVTVNGALTNNSPDNLIIEDGGQLVFNGTGVQATMKKSTAHAAKDAADWYTIASPLNETVTTTSGNANLTTGLDTDEYDLYRYNEKNMKWENSKAGVNSTNFTNIEAGRGYLYWREDGADLVFAGELRNNDVSFALTAGAENDDLKGFNLIGNPFSQNITMSNITGATLTGGYVLTQAGAWGASVETTIAPCQGFLVQVDEEKEIIISKSTGSKSRANRDFIAFTVANGQYEDVTYAMFEEGLGLNKINHRNSDIPMVYIPQNGQNYAIATMGDETQSFNLNFKAMTTGKYTLSYKAEGKYDYLHVIDRITGEDVDMLLDGEYSFMASAGDNDARFIVKLRYDANGNFDSDIFAYQNGNDVIVNGEGELQMFDLTGRMVANTMVNGVQTVNVPAQGVYIFRLVGSDVKTQKIVVR